MTSQSCSNCRFFERRGDTSRTPTIGTGLAPGVVGHSAEPYGKCLKWEKEVSGREWCEEYQPRGSIG